jgi:hypothetical protein
VKKGFRDLYTETWQMVVTETANVGSEAGEGEAVVPSTQQIDPTKPANGKASAKAKGVAAASKKKARVDGEGVGEADDKKKVDKSFGALKLLKCKLNEAQASETDLQTIIATVKAWDWARKPGMTTDMDEAFVSSREVHKIKSVCVRVCYCVCL